MKIVRASDIPIPPPVVVDIDWENLVIVLYGGSGLWTKENPYYVRFSRVSSFNDLVEWMAHLGAKTWTTQGALLKLGHHMLQIIELTYRAERAERPDGNSESPDA